MTLTGAAELSFPQDGDGFAALKATSLSLSDSGTVRLASDNPNGLRHRKVRLVECSDVTGSLDGWRASLPGYCGGVRLSAESDGIYAEFLNPAFIMTVR